MLNFCFAGTTCGDFKFIVQSKNHTLFKESPLGAPLRHCGKIVFFALEKSCSLRNRRGDRYRIAMGPRALTASSGLAPWSMAVDSTSATWRKIQPLLGVKGACPLGLPPPTGGEWGSPSQFPCQLKKLEGFSTEPFFLNFLVIDLRRTKKSYRAGKIVASSRDLPVTRVVRNVKIPYSVHIPKTHS